MGLPQVLVQRHRFVGVSSTQSMEDLAAKIERTVNDRKVQDGRAGGVTIQFNSGFWESEGMWHGDALAHWVEYVAEDEVEFREVGKGEA